MTDQAEEAVKSSLLEVDSAGEILAEVLVVGEIAEDLVQCTEQHVASADKAVKFLSSLQVKSQYIAITVLRVKEAGKLQEDPREGILEGEILVAEDRTALLCTE
jgi:hypothetical protein